MKEEVKQGTALENPRKQKIKWFLPVVVWPLIVAGFHMLGGGRGKVGGGKDGGEGQGFNKILPGVRADKKKETMDKMAIYNQASADSEKREDQLRKDPYHVNGDSNSKTGIVSSIQGLKEGPGQASVSNKNPMRTHVGGLSGLPGSENPVAAEIMQKLRRIQDKAGVAQKQREAAMNALSVPNGLAGTKGAPDMGKLEKMLQALGKQGEPAADPQVDKWNGLLDKIMRIQHPGEYRATDTLPMDPAATSGRVFEVGRPKEGRSINELSEGSEAELPVAGEAFYSLDDGRAKDSVVENVLEATVQEDQTVVAGSTLVLRLTENVVVNGVDIGRNTLLYGVVSLNGERINISISSIRCRSGIYPVSLQVYDLDGLPGIRIPAGLGREVAKESAQEAIGSVGITSIDPSLGAQAASAGIQAAKTFLGRKVRLVRVTVPAGYRLLLKNGRIQNH